MCEKRIPLVLESVMSARTVAVIYTNLIPRNLLDFPRGTF
jgi:hypothetical protein